jgi:hypothetical protein
VRGIRRPFELDWSTCGLGERLGEAPNGAQAAAPMKTLWA